MSDQTNEEPEGGFESEAGKDYEVGYGKPPDHSKFKKGNTFSKGRKSGAKGLKTIVNKAFGKKVSLKENGTLCRKTRTEVGMDQLANKFAQGDHRVTDKSLQLLERYGPQDDPEGPSAERVAANIEALRAYIAMNDQIVSFEEERDDG